MEQIIQKALSKGVEMHVAGDFHLAGQLYETVIKLQPNHADANHNMGLLKLDIGKDLDSLPYLEAALELDTSIAQFWLSYIKALINLERLDQARKILNLAKERGLESEEFVELNQLVNAITERPKVVEAEIEIATHSEHNILDSLKINQALRLAEKKAKEGNTEEALGIYKDILAKFPMNKRAQRGLTTLNKPRKLNRTQNPLQTAINQLINIYNQGHLGEVAERAKSITEQYPEAFIVWNILGAANKGLGRVQAAVDAFKKVIELNPTYADGFNNLGMTLHEQGKIQEALVYFNKALSLEPNNSAACNNMGKALHEQGKLEEAKEAYKKALASKPNNSAAHNNMGKALHEQGKLEEAIDAYRKALTIEPNNSAACNNMGITLQEQGKLEEAKEAYKKALASKPDYAEACNNIGFALQQQGKLEEAMKAYKKALIIKPNCAEAIENSQSLLVQLAPSIGIFGYDFDVSVAHTDSEIVLRPKYRIQNAIKAYLDGDFVQANSHNDDYKACVQHLLGRLSIKDKVFCNAYSTFIGKLLDAKWNEEHSSENKVYHLGESHSLCYAHRNVTIAGLNYNIAPRITFGAKAFHLSQPKYNGFKAITKAHFASLPKGSKVFLSYGEIDCRPNEGFISAAKKHDKPLEEIIDQTTKGYVKWFSDLNADKKHKLYFFNVPAPVYNNKHSADLNSTVARAVALFNNALKKYLKQHGFDMLDVFKFTAGKGGFSNGLFHVDTIHLGAKALEEIRLQLY